MGDEKKEIIFVDDARQRLGILIRLRLPWLIIGLFGGVLASFLVSNFEKTLSKNISLAFFVPIIVYMSDAVGTQTETVYVRSLSRHKGRFLQYLFKEALTGLLLGIFFGLLMSLFAYLWLGSLTVAATVGLAMLGNLIIAPVIALVIPEILFKERADPALGAGPFGTIIQDIISLLIYFLIATTIIG